MGLGFVVHGRSPNTLPGYDRADRAERIDHGPLSAEAPTAKSGEPAIDLRPLRRQKTPNRRNDPKRRNAGTSSGNRDKKTAPAIATGGVPSTERCVWETARDFFINAHKTEVDKVSLWS